jgi:hypothetical protein
MADPVIIPPVTPSPTVPKRRPDGKERGQDRPAQRRPPGKRRQQDDGRPHIDEFA